MFPGYDVCNKIHKPTSLIIPSISENGSGLSEREREGMFHRVVYHQNTGINKISNGLLRRMFFLNGIRNTYRKGFDVTLCGNTQLENRNLEDLISLFKALTLKCD